MYFGSFGCKHYYDDMINVLSAFLQRLDFMDPSVYAKPIMIDEEIQFVFLVQSS